MQANITPEPDDEVRRALLAALAARRDAGDRGAWRGLGLEDTLDDEPPLAPPVRSGQPSRPAIGSWSAWWCGSAP